MIQEKEKHIRETIELLIGQGITEVVESAFTPDYIAHAENKNHIGHDFIKNYILLLRTAIPDIKIKNLYVLMENENSIVWVRSMMGTHKTEMMGIPASGKTIKWNEMVVSRFEDGKIAEEWLVSELAGQLLLKNPIKD